MPGEAAALVFPVLRTASASDIRRYVLHLMTVRRYRVVAVRRNLSALRTFYTFLRREGIRTDHPALDVDLPKAEQRKPKVLRLPEVAAMVKARVERPRGPELAVRDRAMIEVLYGSGMRRAELAGLNLDDVDLGSRTALVTGKGNKTRMVPLTEAAAVAMHSYLTVRPASPTAPSSSAARAAEPAARLADRQRLRAPEWIDRPHRTRCATPLRPLHRGRRRRLDPAKAARSRQHLDDQVYLDQSIAHLRKAFDAAHPATTPPSTTRWRLRTIRSPAATSAACRGRLIG